MPTSSRLARRSAGTTLLELCVVLVITAVLFAIALPRLRGATDRAAARAAIQETGALYALARRSAIARRSIVTVLVDTSVGSIAIRAGATPVLTRGIKAQYGVTVAASRDSMSYDPRGLGYGAANLSVVARRGKAAETLFVSRLGRARH